MATAATSATVRNSPSFISKPAFPCSNKEFSPVSPPGPEPPEPPPSKKKKKQPRIYPKYRVPSGPSRAEPRSHFREVQHLSPLTRTGFRTGSEHWEVQLQNQPSRVRQRWTGEKKISERIGGEKHRKRNENPSGREEQLKRGKKKKEGKWREREGGREGWWKE